MASIEPKIRPKVGVGVMIIRDNKVLLGKRKSSLGHFTFGWTGGHVEFGETLEEAAKREVFEETGLEVIDLKFMCINNIIEYDNHYIDIEFQATVKPGDPVVKEPHKVERWAWYEMNDLPQPLFKAVELAIKCYSNGTYYDAEHD